MKECSEPITSKCQRLESVQHPDCGHEIVKECWVKAESVECQFLPCPKGPRDDCGHACLSACGVDCLKAECLICRKDKERVLKIFKKRAKENIEKMIALSIQNPRSGEFQLKWISKSGTLVKSRNHICRRVDQSTS